MGKKNLLITGAGGLLGGNLVQNYAHKFNIYAIVRSIPKNKLEAVNYIELDLSSNWTSKDLPSNINIICHLAQSSNFRNFPEEALDVFNVNIATTAKLLDYSYKNNVQNFILASSGGVYAKASHAFCENSKIAETHELGYYLGSKRCSEVLASNYLEFMNVSILRFFFIYGAKQNRSMLIPRIIDNVKIGNPIILQGKNGIRINPIHVDDATDAIIETIAKNESSTFNIAGKNIYSLKEIAEIAGELLDKKPIFEYQDAPIHSIVADITAMEEKLHIPKIDFKTGIKDLI